MAFQFVETPDSRQLTTIPPTCLLKYKASGEPNESIVHSYALANTGYTMLTSAGLLNRQDVKVIPDGFAQYWVEVPYAQKQRKLGEWTFNFDTTGATIKIKASKAHVHTYWGSGYGGGSPPANPHNGAIGVKMDGDCEGADIVIPCLKITVTFRHAQGQVTMAKAKALAAATGRTNQNSYISHAAGELLFLGATGSDGSNTEADVAYQFASSSNLTALTFGGISGIAKNGFDVLWEEFAPAVDGGQPASKPSAIHIERVYDPIDFSTALGWS